MIERARQSETRFSLCCANDVRLGNTVALIAVVCALNLTFLGCSTRTPSFSPVGRHPQLMNEESSVVELNMETGTSTPENFIEWRARVIGYDGSDLVAASILGPNFDAEKNPAGLRPLHLSDGYFRTSAFHRITMPATKGALYVRLFQKIQRPETWWREADVVDDEFLALHIQLGHGAEGRANSPCEPSFWKIHNPVREIIHCYTKSPQLTERIRIRLDFREGQPEARVLL